MKYNELIKKAIEISNTSYSPYSSFKVGAALLCEDGEIYCGCNIENASYSTTLCAERTAFSNAICNKKNKFKAIAVVGIKDGKISDFCQPCGVCRQFMSEFCDKDFEIVLFDGKNEKRYTLGELLPLSFGRDNL